jgi:glycosyltransferase involved in cell wall biosynthesis
MRDPRLTVITVAYNAEANIEQTILSVAAQSATGIEYLVIDGASGDGTVEILHLHSQHIARWISEPDNGIYDAMNKGIAMARGEWILFLNADDYFSDADSAQRLLAAADDSVSIIAGRTLMKYADGDRVFRPSRRFGLMLQLPFMHPSTIVRRSAFEACGDFDLRYALAADCDFFLRAIARGHRHRCIDDVVTVMRHGGASTRGFVRGRLEYMTAYMRNMHDPVGACVGFALSMLMNLKAKLR